MNVWSWSVVVLLAAASSAVVIVTAPRHDLPRFEVRLCGENGIRTQSPSGHVACTLKNGQTIFLRSAK